MKFLEASFKGWVFCRDNFDACVAHVNAAEPPFGGPGHQTWMLNEINKLIWPSPGGLGVMDQALWDQTIQIAVDQGVLQGAPDDGAFRTDLAEEAIANLEAEGVDVRGLGYTPTEVQITEGGA